MRMLWNIVLGVTLLLGLLGVALGGSGFGRFDGKYADGAIANAVEDIGPRLFSLGFALIAAIGIAANAITAAIRAQTEALRDLLVAQRKSVTPAPPVVPAGKVDDMPGRLPGESPEAWAKRLEREDVARFKAGTR